MFLINKIWIYSTIIFVVVITIALIAVLVVNRIRKPHYKIDENFIDSIILSLGGKENISKVSVINTRVSFDCVSLEKVDLEKLKAISLKGVFVTDNHVKTLFSYDSLKIVKEIERKIH